MQNLNSGPWSICYSEFAFFVGCTSIPLINGLELTLKGVWVLVLFCGEKGIYIFFVTVLHNFGGLLFFFFSACFKHL